MPIVLQLVNESLPQVRSFFEQGKNVSSWHKYWWKYISEDNLLYHSTLQLSALDLDMRRGVPDFNPARAQLSLKCVKLLRQRIEEGSDGTSDNTLAAIVFLLVVEVSIFCLSRLSD